MTSIPRLTGAVLTALATLMLGLPAQATDEPSELMPGRIGIVKPGRLVKFVAKAPRGGPLFLLPSAANDPTTEGGTLEMFDTTSPGAGYDTYNLPSSGWKRLPQNTSRPLRGFKYRGAGTGGDPCKVVLVKEKVVKGVCRGSGVTLTPPFQGELGVILTVGTDSKQYCASYGGLTSRNDSSVLRRRKADAPSDCPVQGVATTTTITPATTTTTTTVGGPCCAGKDYFRFETHIGDPVRDCGDLTLFNGAFFKDVQCGGLSLGGGQNSVPWPKPVPDFGKTISAITSCTGQTGTVGPVTSTDTGSNLNCSAPGCLFGAPLPLPNTASTPTSTCVINTVATGVSGTIHCGLGTQDVSLPLDSEVFLTGDALPLKAGLQPCALCTGGSPFVTNSGTCEGGANNGQPCTPHSSDQGGLPQYPTSHDCPPSLGLSLGTIPIGFALTTGTVEWTATPAANPTSSGQVRVFSGYCRDADITGCFEGNADGNPACPSSPPGSVLCWENGVAVGSPCAQPWEACQQRSQGAVGPGGNAVKTITAIGLAAGSIVDCLAHDQILASIFSIPETTSASVNNAADLPGPGMVALDGVVQLCTTPNPCP